MFQFMKLMIIVMMPVLALIIHDFVETRLNNANQNSDTDDTNASTRMRDTLNNIIWGVVFGFIAVISVRCGSTLDTFWVNSSNSSILVAGLFISGPSGIIAGIIAALDRCVALLSGGDEICLVADAVATLISGAIAFFFRKVLFEDKRPNWFMAVFGGFVIEIIHLALVFTTNLQGPERVIGIVQGGTAPLLIVSCLVLLLSSSVAYFVCPVNKVKLTKKRSNESKSIFELIQIWLLNVIVLAFCIVCVFMIVIEMNLAKTQIDEQFKLALEEVSRDVSDASDNYQLTLTRMIASDIENGDDDLAELVDWYNVSEINIINKNGIIVKSSNPDFVGFDMQSGDQSRAFMHLLDRSYEYAQEYSPISANSDVYMKYAAVRTTSGLVQMGYNAENFQKELNKELKTTLKNRHIGKAGFFVVLDENKKVVSTSSNFKYGSSFDIAQIDFSNIEPNVLVKRTVNGVSYYCIYNITEGYDLMAFCSVEDAMTTGIISIYIAVFNMILIFVVLFVLVYLLIKKLVVNQIISMANSLGRITNGDLTEVVNVRSNAEFASLSDDINSTVDTLKRYIAEAASRIDAELEFAKSIQLSAMPSHFPAFPNRQDMDIYARMDTAKEVGGDFYDFYFTDRDTLNFMIADVSGKGIPAAMFMMRAKSVLRGQAGTGHDIDQVFTESNEMLCAENDANMFVTAWQGQINLNTGMMYIANAGHNPALIKRKGGQYEYLRLKANLVLASMDGIAYRKHELQLNEGDIVFLYTDGVTEATDINDELYGETRLIDTLNKCQYQSLQGICDAVKADVDAFVGEAPQFDDITMVAFEYKGNRD